MPLNVDEKLELSVENSKPESAAIEMVELKFVPVNVKLEEVDAVPYVVESDVKGPPPELMKGEQAGTPVKTTSSILNCAVVIVFLNRILRLAVDGIVPVGEISVQLAVPPPVALEYVRPE